MITKGQLVVFKPEWQDEGEVNITFRALETEFGHRVLVVAELGLAINPTQIVSTFMIKDNS